MTSGCGFLIISTNLLNEKVFIKLSGSELLGKLTNCIDLFGIKYGRDIKAALYEAFLPASSPSNIIVGLLVLDFVDGNRKNHNYDNLRMLCFNCSFLINGNLTGPKKEYEY